MHPVAKRTHHVPAMLALTLLAASQPAQSQHDAGPPTDQAQGCEQRESRLLAEIKRREDEAARLKEVEAQLLNARTRIADLEDALRRKAPPTSSPKAKPGPMRFPFGWSPDTTKEQIEEKYSLLCLDEAEDGSLRCYIDARGELALSVSNFEVEKISLVFVATERGDYVLGDVTLMQGGLEECEEMSSSYLSATALLSARYSGKGVKVKKGKAYGSTACKFYMNEGQVFVANTSQDWEARVDTFFLGGEYQVYLSIEHKPTTLIRATRAAREKMDKTMEGLGKL